MSDVIMDGYVRVSRVLGREGDSYISPTVQRESIERWAAYKDVTIAEWHVDEDWSGGTHSRPGLDRAIRRALDGETSGIVSAKIDRFSRNTEAGLRDLRRLQEKGARLAFVVEDIDTGTVHGRMLYTILLAVSEAFLENVKASWITAKERATMRGAYVSRTPFGYQRRDDGTLEPHPQNAAIVTEAFRLAAGQSLQAAQSYLERAVPTRRWTATKVRRLLSGYSYLGETRHSGNIAEGTHAPLVSRAIWEAAQSTPVVRSSAGEFPLSGVIACGTCGAAMVGGRGGRNRLRTYRCSRSINARMTDKCPKPPSITAHLVEDHLREIVRDALAGWDATIGYPELDELTLIERERTEARAELDAFAADLTLRRALGDRYHDHLQARVDECAKWDARYRERAQSAQAMLRITGPEVADDDELFPIALRSMFDAVLVRPGRGMTLDERLVLVPLGGDGASGVASP